MALRRDNMACCNSATIQWLIEKRGRTIRLDDGLLNNLAQRLRCLSRDHSFAVSFIRSVLCRRVLMLRKTVPLVLAASFMLLPLGIGLVGRVHSRDERPTTGNSVQWRRTARGWEQTSRWPSAIQPSEPRIAAVHPAVIAALQLLISSGALIVFAPSRKARPRSPAGC